MAPRLLVTGGAGFLGTYLLQKAISSYTVAATLHQTPAAAIPGVSFHICDLQQPEQVKTLLNRVKPDTIIHSACSEHGKGLEAIVPAAGILAMLSAERHIRFIHLSTDQVFDGTAAPYKESSPTCPIHPYGQAKAQAEALVTSFHPKATIVRASLLYDVRKPDRHTTSLIDAVNTGEQYTLFTDEFRCPLWVENLADALLELARTDFTGILHVAGPESLNRWDLGIQLLEHYGVTPKANIQKGTIEESGLVRPKDLTFASYLYQRILKTHLLPLQETKKKHQD